MDMGIIFIIIAVLGIAVIAIRIRSFKEYKDRHPKNNSDDYEELKDKIMAERMRRNAVKRFNSNQW